MSEVSKNQKLVQVTSIDVLLDNDNRVTWQGFRPVGATKKNLTTYFSTLPGDGSGSTKVNLVDVGAQSPDAHSVELTLIAGEAILNGAKLTLNKGENLGPRGNGDAAELVFTGETCTLKVCPKPVKSPAPEAMAKSGNGDGGSAPPPPYPGGNQNN